jgi:hypothetical protein
MSLELDALPATVTSCSVGGLPLELDSHPSRAPRVHIPLAWSQLPLEGAIPLPLPHVTLRCVLRLADEEAVFAAGSPQFDISVHNDQREIGRARATMRGLSTAALVVRVGLHLHEKLLSAEKLDALLHAVADVAVDLIAGLSAEQVSVHGQEGVAGGVTLVTFDLTSRGMSAVTVDAVKAIAADLVAAARSLGYTVAGGAEHSVSSHFLDAACSYTCGAGCSLCDDEASCVWDLDCRSGSCREGVCHTPASSPTDLTLLWVALVVVVVGASGFVLLRHLQKKIHQRSQEALLTDMDDLEDV